MSKYKKADREPTKVSLVLQALVAADDFITAGQLITRLGGKVNANQVGASLHHLRNRHAVVCMASDGKLWWYSTPDLDDRLRIVEEKVVETEPRRRRGTAVVPIGAKRTKYTKPRTSSLAAELREANEIADRIRNKGAQ